MVLAAATIHIIVCVALCVVVLLQQGKGADIGAVFGGSSQTVFGAGGAGNALTKATWTLAALFFATSIFLAITSARRTTGSIFEGGPFSSAPQALTTTVANGTPGANGTPASAPKPMSAAPAAQAAGQPKPAAPAPAPAQKKQ
ncbi:MAG TPA: preprotein translocase subunit SecG [Candidatus Binataceae bacterium]|nr:preprotein translocase subunit SecG [Candidatus Binataceae bacterium]